MNTQTGQARADRPSWSYSIGRFLGIDVFVHGSFLILVAFLGLSQFAATGSATGAAVGMLALFAVFACVLLHEYGHALAARRYGIETKRITLLPIGGIAQLERMPEKPREQLVVAFAGPLVNLVLATVAFGLHSFSGTLGLTTGASVEAALMFLVWVNVAMFVFNLLPALPMDGGRILRAILAMRMRALRATEVAAHVGRFFAIGLGVVGLFVNPFLILIAVFVWFGATQEVQLARARVGLSGASVGTAMATEFVTLSPTDRLSEAAERIMRTHQSVFPVEHGGQLVGLVTQDDLLAAVAEGKYSAVGTIMSTQFDSVEPHEDLEPVFLRLLSQRQGSLPVVEGARLVGLITREGLQRFVALRTAVANPSVA